MSCYIYGDGTFDLKIHAVVIWGGGNLYNLDETEREMIFYKTMKQFFSNLFSTWKKCVSLNCGNFCRTTHMRTCVRIGPILLIWIHDLYDYLYKLWSRMKLLRYLQLKNCQSYTIWKKVFLKKRVSKFGSLIWDTIWEIMYEVG